jgi:hypothetical protein
LLLVREERTGLRRVVLVRCGRVVTAGIYWGLRRNKVTEVGIFVGESVAVGDWVRGETIPRDAESASLAPVDHKYCATNYIAP